MNYYDILNVPQNASTDEIKKAYRKLSFENHPDKNNNDSIKTEIFKNVNEAYDILSDKRKKSQYDQSLNYNEMDIPDLNEGLNDIFSSLLKNMNQSPNKKNKSSKKNLFNLFDDFENTTPYENAMFMHVHPSSLNMPPHLSGTSSNFIEELPEDIIVEHKITYQEAYDGCCIPISIEREIIQNHKTKKEKESLYITLQAGVDNNETIVLENKGNIINGKKSNLKLVIQLENNHYFQRNGIDLILHKELNFKESLCGFSFDIHHLNKNTIKFNSSKGNVIQNEDKKIIQKLGFKRNDNIGNLIIHFHVNAPKKLTEDEIKVIDEIF